MELSAKQMKATVWKHSNKKIFFVIAGKYKTRIWYPADIQLSGCRYRLKTAVAIFCCKNFAN